MHQFFDKKHIHHYIIAFALIVFASVVGNRFKQTIEGGSIERDYKLIQKYLLANTGSNKTVENYDTGIYSMRNYLFQDKKPILWIHTEYKTNSRIWESFSSRNTKNLNQPYIHLTIYSIVKACQDDFNICLVNDALFNEIVPEWTISVADLPEPYRYKYREIAMLKLLYTYGGMIVPNSFLCFKNLKYIYNHAGNIPVIGENVNYYSETPLFVPDLHFIAATRHSMIIHKCIKFIEACVSESENAFYDEINTWLMDLVKSRNMRLISGQDIGTMDTKFKPILLDHLMLEECVYFPTEAMGVYIPAKEILVRPKYQWFAVLSKTDVLKGNTCLSKQFNRISYQPNILFA